MRILGLRELQCVSISACRSDDVVVDLSWLYLPKFMIFSGCCENAVEVQIASLQFSRDRVFVHSCCVVAGSSTALCTRYHYRAACGLRPSATCHLLFVTQPESRLATLAPAMGVNPAYYIEQVRVLLLHALKLLLFRDFQFQAAVGSVTLPVFILFVMQWRAESPSSPVGKVKYVFHRLGVVGRSESRSTYCQKMQHVLVSYFSLCSFVLLLRLLDPRGLNGIWSFGLLNQLLSTNCTNILFSGQILLIVDIRQSFFAAATAVIYFQIDTLSSLLQVLENSLFSFPSNFLDFHLIFIFALAVFDFQGSPAPIITRFALSLCALTFLVGNTTVNNRLQCFCSALTTCSLFSFLF